MKISAKTVRMHALADCTGLTALPQGLTVEGRLDLWGCTGLTHLCVGADSRRYRFYRVAMRDGVHVVAGCRNFTAEQARAHWAEGTECRALAEACLRGEQ